ncbi:CPBP family intramembrane glutamic endopeptidase [Treponema putidum]|uniref:CPBP family intramembrane metalloprotease n=1 Tax=Treponema putidum TaxID=221027 RepID=A0AAE9MSM9_9SPIR|nr:CPBP family intramembrane glutamic endopeptidase [Treponema putidum]UTY29372.1 CPBP family intramembrane metalloprotease [Treponema putidum]UTY34225.1 CPBP family intramembrane metalloprotease [Treponema putidum]
MPYNKKKILTVFYWFISVIFEAFIAFFIIDIIYVYIFMYKEEYWSIILTIVYTVLGIAVITFKRFQENKNLLQFKPFKFSTVIKILLLAISITMFITWVVFRDFNYFKNIIQNSIIYFLNRFTGKESFTIRTIFNTYFIYEPLVFRKFITALIIAPIYEELIFRGVIYDDTKKLFNAKIAALVSSILFGLMHFNGGYLQVTVTMLDGLLLAYCYEKTQSLYACILLHSLNNFMSVVIYRLLDWRAFVLLTLICAFACIIMLIAEVVRYFGKRKAVTEIGIN